MSPRIFPTLVSFYFHLKQLKGVSIKYGPKVAVVKYISEVPGAERNEEQSRVKADYKKLTHDCMLISLQCNRNMSQFSSRVEKGRRSRNSPDNQVDDAEVEDLFVGVIVGDLLLLFLDLPHQLLSL